MKPGVSAAMVPAFALITTDAADALAYLATTRASHLTAEQRLMWAVLQDAMENIARPRGRESWRQRGLDVEWVRQANSRWIFSFDNVCEFLKVDAEALRKLILRREPLR